MTNPTEPDGKELRLLRHARREGALIMIVWATALFWSVGCGYVMGYHRDPASIRLIYGMPDWVFWSVALPWGVCLAFSVWFCFGYMADDDLGEDRAGGPGRG